MTTFVSMASPTLADRLKALRQFTGLSARAISELAGLKGATYLTKIETGIRPHPSATILIPIARLYGTTVEWLVTGDGIAPTRDDVLAAIEAAHTRPKRKARRTPVAA